MRLFGAVVVTFIAFVGIWMLAAFLSITIAFRGWGEGGVAEYARLAVAWFICPGVGAFFGPQVANHLVGKVNMHEVMVSFITLAMVVCGGMFFLALVTFSDGAGGSIGELFQFAFQSASILVGALLAKSGFEKPSAENDSARG